MKNSIMSEDEVFDLYGLLLKVSSSLSLLSSLDSETLDNQVNKKELLVGIKHLSKSINNDVEKCIKLTNM